MTAAFGSLLFWMKFCVAFRRAEASRPEYVLVPPQTYRDVSRGSFGRRETNQRRNWVSFQCELGDDSCKHQFLFSRINIEHTELITTSFQSKKQVGIAFCICIDN